MKKLWITTILLVLFASLAMGQGARTATLVGTVTDTTDAVVPAATVTVTNTGTQFVSTGVTNAEGAYYIPFLAVGSYEISVEVPGFKKFVQRGIQLRAGETPRINIRLELGSTIETVQVTASAPLLATETSQVSSTVEAEAIRALPVMQMKAHRILYYMEGLQIRGANASVLGQSANALGFTLDGVSGKTSVRDGIGDTNTSVQPALDALAEAKVYTTGAPAELGHASGGIMSMTFKSGTNELHGSIDERWTNNPMIHRGYLEQGKRVNPITFHQAQATISGPVVIPKLYDGRNRTFFLFAYGRHHEKTDEPQTNTVPDLNMLNGDFSFPQVSNGGYPIYDPASIRQENGVWTADQFAGKIIPKSRFDPVATKFLALNPWAAPNNLGSYTRTGPTNNWQGYTVYRSYRSRFDTKIDQQISAGHKFFVRASINRHRQLGRINGWVNNRELDAASFSFGRPNPIDQQNWAFADYHTFSPTLMNEFRLGFGRRVSIIDPPTANADWAQQLGIPNVSGANFPLFRSGTSANLFGIGPGAYSKNINEEVTLQNNVTKIQGRHIVKFGYELLRTRENNVDQTLPSGRYTFDVNGTALPFTPNTGHMFASFLLGSVTDADFTQQIFNRLPRWWSHGLYIQTDWKVIPTLTLNIGLRYTLETPFKDKWDNVSQFDPNVIDPLTGNLGAIIHPRGGSLYKTDRNNFQPRFGMAWNFKPNMVFRGSFGVLTQDVMPRAGFEEYSATAYVQPTPGDPRPAFFLSQGPPNRNFVVNPDGSSPYIGTNYGGRNATYIDPNLRLPYIMNWAAGLQIQLGPTWLTEVNYQGSAGVGLVGDGTAPNINQLPKWIYDSTDLAVLNAARTAGQNYKVYTHFGNVRYTTNAGHNTYHGVTTRIEKRYSPNGLTLNAHYTWSKNLAGFIGDGWQYYDWGLTKAPTSFDTRHRIILQGMYDLPFGRGKAFMNGGGWRDVVLGGWNVVMIQTLQSGQPATFAIQDSPNFYLPGPSRPNQILPNEDVKVENWTMGPHRFPQSAQNPFYNINAFEYPASYTPGSLGAGTSRGRWLIWPQWSLSKSWSFAERCRFSLRLDGTNIPVAFMGTTPNLNVNLLSPQNFGKFPPQGGSNYSTMGGANGQLVISGRFQF